MKQYDLDFNGYWIDKDYLPHESGVYFVYRGTYSKATDKVNPRELIYIGQAEDIYNRHHPHEKQKEFESTLQDGEILMYSLTILAKDDLDRVECGLIYKRKPRLNDKCTCSFDYPETRFVLSGACDDFYPKDFTLEAYEHC